MAVADIIAVYVGQFGEPYAYESYADLTVFTKVSSIATGSETGKLTLRGHFCFAIVPSLLGWPYQSIHLGLLQESLSNTDFHHLGQRPTGSRGGVGDGLFLYHTVSSMADLSELDWCRSPLAKRIGHVPRFRRYRYDYGSRNTDNAHSLCL